MGGIGRTFRMKQSQACDQSFQLEVSSPSCDWEEQLNIL